MVETLRRAPLVRAEDLARRFDVSIETVRRDLMALETEGVLERVYGGARGLSARSFEPPVAERRRQQVAAKRAIAGLVVGLLEPGDTVIFDAGTTVAEAARRVPWDFKGRVLTNSLPVVLELEGRPGVEVLVCGGNVRSGDMALSGAQAERFFDDFYADKAFLGSGGVHHEAGLTDFYPAEVAVRQRMLRHAGATYVLADSSKIGHIALCRVCELAAVTAVISDSGASASSLEGLRDAGASVLVAEVGNPQAEDGSRAG